MTAEKPPYRIPLMDEVRATPWNGRHVVSIFAGCGGSSTGYRMDGYRVLAACESSPPRKTRTPRTWPPRRSSTARTCAP